MGQLGHSRRALQMFKLTSCKTRPPISNFKCPAGVNWPAEHQRPHFSHVSRCFCALGFADSRCHAASVHERADVTKSCSCLGRSRLHRSLCICTLHTGCCHICVCTRSDAQDEWGGLDHSHNGHRAQSFPELSSRAGQFSDKLSIRLDSLIAKLASFDSPMCGQGHVKHVAPLHVGARGLLPF